MNKQTLLVLLGVILLFTISGCKDVGGAEWEDFAIYRLQDASINSYDAGTIPLSSLELAPIPFITAKDIRAYYWETHAIEFTPAMDSVMESFTRNAGRTSGVPFVVTVGFDRIYLGTFWWAYSSSLPACPFMETISPKPRRISLPSLGQVTDPRGDVRIYMALQKAGVLASALTM